MNLDARLKIARENTSDWVNCIGTALYLLGLQDEDKAGFAHEVWKHIDHRDYTDFPVDRYKIAIWYDRDRTTILPSREEIHEVSHMALVLDMQARAITHRIKMGGEFQENIPLTRVEWPPQLYVRYHTLG